MRKAILSIGLRAAPSSLLRGPAAACCGSCLLLADRGASSAADGGTTTTSELAGHKANLTKVRKRSYTLRIKLIKSYFSGYIII